MSKLKLKQFKPFQGYKVFDQEFGHIHLEIDPFNISPISVKLSECELSIFEVVHPEFYVPRINTTFNPPLFERFETLKTFSFLSKYENYKGNNGVLVMYNGFEQTQKGKMGYDKVQLRKDYIETIKLVAKRENCSLIYNGFRNEG